MDILVVCYDIKDRTRRDDVSEFLENHGGCRAQESVFELEVDEIEDEVPTTEEILKDCGEGVIDASEAIKRIRESKAIRNRAIKRIKAEIKDKINLRTDKVDIYRAKKICHLGKKGNR